MARSDSGRKPASGRLPAWFDRTERALRIGLFALLVLLILFHLMPFSQEIREWIGGLGRWEGVPYRRL